MDRQKLNLKKADMGEVIDDFYDSDAPQFKGKSKEKRRQMAIAAKLQADEERACWARPTQKWVRSLKHEAQKRQAKLVE